MLFLMFYSALIKYFFKTLAIISCSSIFHLCIVDTQFTLLIIQLSSQLLLESCLEAHNTLLEFWLGAFVERVFKGEVKECFYWAVNKQRSE